ncbi:MAG: galactitol-1-phosphate 5-dehydrogenase [Clostridiales bacterium]|jgi:L-iditol 2-dehydrogenase|nr:galactitol-1-phosphate 5-dehydrogenase [Clostridiales bacterium]
MKAAVLFANGDIRYSDFQTPEVKPGTVKVKIRASGICGSDIPRVLYNGAHYYPIVLGHEFSGEVVEIGEGVADLRVGDTVSGAPLIPCLKCADCLKGNYSLCKNYSFVGSREQGSFAQYVVIPERNAVNYNREIPFEIAAMFEPSAVALHGLFCNDFRGGYDAAIIGGGTIGIFTMQWAKIYGAKTVTVFDISDDRLELAKRLGADFTVNTLRETPAERFSYVFETAGQVSAMRNAFEIAGNKACVCFVGTPRENLTFTPKEWENMNRREFRLTGSWMSYSAPFPGDEWSLTAHFFHNGQLRFDDSMIFKRFPLSEAANAFKLFENPSDVKGKVMLFNE